MLGSGARASTVRLSRALVVVIVGLVVEAAAAAAAAAAAGEGAGRGVVSSGAHFGSALWWVRAGGTVATVTGRGGAGLRPGPRRP